MKFGMGFGILVGVERTIELEEFFIGLTLSWGFNNWVSVGAQNIKVAKSLNPMLILQQSFCG